MRTAVRVFLTLCVHVCAAELAEFASFGVITDVHYADAAPAGTRHYRDSLPKVRQAVRDFSTTLKPDFLMELGDFKDTDVSQGCGTGRATAKCTTLTLQFLSTIEAEMAKFPGPRFHLLGNHDVDVLNQSAVLAHITDSALAEAGGPGYYSFGFPFAKPPVGADTVGCLARESSDAANVWLMHADGTRNWLSAPPSGAVASAFALPSIAIYPKRHGGTGAYNLDAADSATAFAQRCVGCKCDDHGVPAALPAAASTRTPPLRFIALNGDYTGDDRAWSDLDGKAVPGEAWDDANVPTRQMEWLAEELRQAEAAKQRVIVFIHYRLDGGPGGPVGTGLGPHAVPDRAWVDDCTLSNAAVVRALLEQTPGLVLATFSGHDHAPKPQYTHAARGKPAYVTFAATVEGPWPASNAYSRVSILADCTIVVHGFGSGGYNATVAAPEGCALGSV